MTKLKEKTSKNKFGYTPVYLMILILFSAVALVVIVSKIDFPEGNSYLNLNPRAHRLTRDHTFKKFASVDEFKEYLDEMEQDVYYSMGQPQMMMNETVGLAPKDNDFALGMGGGADRVSDTNVQVVGIDEPDIVKTDGSQIYFSDNTRRYYNNFIQPEPILDLVDESVSVDFAPKYINETKTNIINAWPPSDLELSSAIDLAGDLLLVDDILLVFSGQDIVAYDVSNPKKPTKKWDIKLEDQTYLVTSRLYDDQVYLVTQTRLNRYNPCPITPLTRQNQAMIVSCGDIYYPNSPTQIDSTFTVISLNPASGEFDDQISFVGNQSTANIYMSTEALYVAYTQNLDMFDFMFDFISKEMNDVLPANIIVKLNKLSTYDISNTSKLNELQTILEEWRQSLDKDEMLKMDNEMQNRIVAYYEKNKRLMVTTGIAKIDIDNLEIKASGSVPGHLLNQFAMDEFDGYLRVATTVGDRWGFGGSDSQANDVYVLDDNLKIKGSIIDLGLTERIYAARFIGDLGYLVTFRQTDPFYVLDLSNPKKPQMVGELKIPGYSSYLHPITKDKILGIGMENRQVKLSYFDVSDPKNPKEIAKYSLDEYGSETLYNHHAFLQDSDHEVFFLPSYKGGYIFSYANDEIELVRALSVPDVKRALYLDDYMYIIANDYIAVLNENDWEKVNDLDL